MEKPLNIMCHKYKKKL